jgi:alditol oxidase
MTGSNWAGNHRYQSAHLHEPETIDELRTLVGCSERLKVLGTRHSFNDIADTTGDHVSLARFDRVLAIGDSTVTVEPAITYGGLYRQLHAAGLALHNLASLPHISVAGACATATHGSGDANGNLATAVSAIELVTADGDVKRFSRGDEAFDGVVVSLGALGVVTRLTLDVVPSFQIRQSIYENLPFEPLLSHFDAITSAAYSVSLFTDWRGDAINQVWLKRRDGEDDRSRMMLSLGTTSATADVHPIPGMPTENCTTQMGVPGSWHERLPHFRMEFTPSSGEELQSEYFVPREHAAEALRAINGLRERIAPLLHISEIRTIAADELWMSPHYRRPSVGIHFTWRKDWPAVREMLPVIETALVPLGARPHWGKLFTMPPQWVQSQYERLDNFRKLIEAFDPRGKFRNAFLDRYVYATP